LTNDTINSIKQLLCNLFVNILFQLIQQNISFQQLDIQGVIILCGEGDNCKSKNTNSVHLAKDWLNENMD